MGAAVLWVPDIIQATPTKEHELPTKLGDSFPSSCDNLAETKFPPLGIEDESKMCSDLGRPKVEHRGWK